MVPIPADNVTRPDLVPTLANAGKAGSDFTVIVESVSVVSHIHFGSAFIRACHRPHHAGSITCAPGGGALLAIRV